MIQQPTWLVGFVVGSHWTASRRAVIMKRPALLCILPRIIMPAPSFLKGLPKPVLFGLYGAIGGLLGALVFGEPLYRLLEPPKAEAAPPPEPQLAVTASPEVQVYQSSRNTFTVQIARAEFDDAVTIRFEGLPAGVTIAQFTIPKGQTDGTATVVADATATAATLKFKVIAEAKVNGKTITADTSVQSVVSEPGRAMADVFFVLDVTASMDNAIRGVADGIGGFATYLRDNKIDFRVGLVAFRDLWHEEPRGILQMEVLKFDGAGKESDSFTTDDVAFSRKVGRLQATGGGDAPESTLDAIIEASKQPFRKSATKVLLIVTDNPPKPLFDPNGRTFDEQTAPATDFTLTADKVKVAGIDFVHFVLKDKDFGTYRLVQNAGTGKGRTFDLDKVKDDPNSFRSLVSDFSKDVMEAAKAKNPEGKPQVSAQATKPEIGVKALQSEKSYTKGSEGQLGAGEPLCGLAQFPRLCALLSWQGKRTISVGCCRRRAALSPACLARWLLAWPAALRGKGCTWSHRAVRSWRRYFRSSAGRFWVGWPASGCRSSFRT